MNRRKFLVGAAVTGLAAGTVMAQDSKDSKKAATHDCAGKNACKGQGGCKTGDAGCKGKNSCKGKGGCAVPAKKN